MNQISLYQTQPIGTALQTIEYTAEDCQTHDCGAGRLVTDALLNYCPSCDFAVVHSNY